MTTQSLRPHGITLPITSDCQRMAEQFARQCSFSEKEAQIRRNTLAVCAVNTYLELMEIDTDLTAGDSWQPMMQMMADVADLHLPAVGVLSCRAIAPGDDSCYVPPEDWADRAGYVAVELDEASQSATLLGFATTVDDTEQVPLGQFEPIEALIDQVHALSAIAATDGSTSVAASAASSAAAAADAATETVRSALTRLGGWAEGAFETSWQAADALINPNSLSFAFRTTAELAEREAATDISRAKLIDLGIQLGQAMRVALVVHLTKDAEGRTDLVLQVRPLGESPYLAEGLSLTVLDEQAVPVMSVTSRAIDNYIQIQLSGRSGEPFGVKVAMGEAVFEEKFVI